MLFFKRLIFLLITLLIFLLVAQYLLRDELDLIGVLKFKILGGDKPEIYAKPARVMETIPSKEIINPAYGRWSRDSDKARIMVPVFKSRTRGYKMSKPTDLAVTRDGFYLITDRVYGRHIELDSTGKFSRYFYLRQKSESPFDYPKIVKFKKNKMSFYHIFCKMY